MLPHARKFASSHPFATSLAVFAGLATAGKVGGKIYFSGRDDEYNEISGMRHGGMSSAYRRALTDFGSGYQGDQSLAQRKFDVYDRALAKYGVKTGTGHQRILIPKTQLSQEDITSLGFVPVVIAIPEAGQVSLTSYRHPNLYHHLHNQGDAWSMHKDADAATTMLLLRERQARAAGKKGSIFGTIAEAVKGIPHLVIEGVPGAFYYTKGKITGAIGMRQRLEEELPAQYDYIANNPLTKRTQRYLDAPYSRKDEPSISATRVVGGAAIGGGTGLLKSYVFARAAKSIVGRSTRLTAISKTDTFTGLAVRAMSDTKGGVLFSATIGAVAGGVGAYRYQVEKLREKRLAAKEKYNTIEGLHHGGMAEASRHEHTEFGSGWQGPPERDRDEATNLLGLASATLGGAVVGAGKRALVSHSFRDQAVLSVGKPGVLPALLRWLGKPITRTSLLPAAALGGLTAGYYAHRKIRSKEKYNTIEALGHSGISGIIRSKVTDFGSGQQMQAGASVANKLLATIFRATDQEILEHVPQGMSRLGGGEALTEMIFEEVRKADFPSLPDRMKSTFWTGSLSDATGYGVRRGARNGPFTQSYLSETEIDPTQVFFGYERHFQTAMIGTRPGHTKWAESYARQYWEGPKWLFPVTGPSLPTILQGALPKNQIDVPSQIALANFEILLPDKIVPTQIWKMDPTKFSKQFPGVAMDNKLLNYKMDQVLNQMAHENRLASILKKPLPHQGFGPDKFGWVKNPPPQTFSAKDDVYNTIEGMRHGGIASELRRANTGFGSGYRGLIAVNDVLGRSLGWFKESIGGMKLDQKHIRKYFSQNLGNSLRKLKKHNRTSDDIKLIRSEYAKLLLEVRDSKRAGHVAVQFINTGTTEIGGSVRDYARKISEFRNEHPKFAVKRMLGDTIRHEDTHIGSHVLNKGMEEGEIPSAEYLRNAPTKWNKFLKAQNYNDGRESSFLEEMYAFNSEKYLPPTLRTAILGEAKESLSPTTLAAFEKRTLELRKAGKQSRLDKAREFRKTRVFKDGRFLAKDIEALRHDGIAHRIRRAMTDFGSGWRGIIRRALEKGTSGASGTARSLQTILANTAENLESVFLTSRWKHQIVIDVDQIAEEAKRFGVSKKEYLQGTIAHERFHQGVTEHGLTQTITDLDPTGKVPKEFIEWASRAGYIKQEAAGAGSLTEEYFAWAHTASKFKQSSEFTKMFEPAWQRLGIKARSTHPLKTSKIINSKALETATRRQTMRAYSTRKVAMAEGTKDAQKALAVNGLHGGHGHNNYSNKSK